VNTSNRYQRHLRMIFMIGPGQAMLPQSLLLVVLTSATLQSLKIALNQVRHYRRHLLHHYSNIKLTLGRRAILVLTTMHPLGLGARQPRLVLAQRIPSHHNSPPCYLCRLLAR
jgi:hypothetical protein